MQKDIPAESADPPASGGWLNRTVLGIALASLCSDVGHEMATTAMPALLASLGASAMTLGLIEGAADALSSFAKMYSGLYSDRLPRRKPLAVIGYLVTASGMASFSLATASWQIFLARTGAWMGRGVRTPVRNVLMTEATTPETYGRAFGFERAMDSAGAVIGPLIAWSVLHFTGAPLQSLFVWTLVPGIAAVLCIALLVREKPHAPRQRTPLTDSFASLPKAFKAYLLGVSIAGLGDFSNTLLILWATQAWTERLGPEAAAQRAMLFYVGYNVVYMCSCYVAGLLADRLPKHWVLGGGYSLAVIPAIALLTPGDSMAKFAVVFGVSGVYMGFWETLESVTAATLLPKERRGVGFGTLATLNGVGDFVSSALVGTLWVFSPAASMGIVAAASLIGAAIIVRTGQMAQAAPGD